MRSRRATGWDLDGLTLTFVQTTDDKGTLSTPRTFGKCLPTASGEQPEAPIALGSSEEWQTVALQLCETAAWFRWNVTVTTASGLGAGTDADVAVSLACGSKPATNGQLALKCPLTTDCFERWGRQGGRAGQQGARKGRMAHRVPAAIAAQHSRRHQQTPTVSCSGSVDQFSFTFDPANPDASFMPANDPVPTCTAAGVRPVLSVTFSPLLPVPGECAALSPPRWCCH